MPREPHPDPAPHPRSPSERPVRIAAAALLRDGRHGTEVLIARRHAHAVRGGLWEYPGGKVAPGETAEQAAARELLEETGIAVDPVSGTVVAHSAHEDSGLHRESSISIVLVRFACPTDAEPRALAAAECRWELVARLDGYDWPAANRPLNAALRASVEGSR